MTPQTPLMTSEVLRRGPQAVKIGPWAGAARTALIAPALGLSRPVTPEFIRWCCATLAERGFKDVVTPALMPHDTGVYRHAGFDTHEHLHLLSHQLGHLVPVPETRARLRRGRTGDLDDVVAIDHDAFRPFWHFDADGISQARAITPRARFRVASHADRLTGYAVTGLGDDQGYLQRLAVSPGDRRQRIGAALVLDALHWLRRRDARLCMVNTQIDNDGALSLYRAVGFELEPVRLVVLILSLT